MKKITSLALGLILLTLTACSSSISSIDLMTPITKEDISPIEIASDEQDKTDEIMDFAFNILENSYAGDNILISPLSIISALAMTANGADGNTLAQMEHAFGTDINSLNDYLYSYTSYLPNDEKYQVTLANSIWVKTGSINLYEDFLQTNKNYYDASIYEDDFDNSTLNDINNWVKNETAGQIKKAIDEIGADTMMYLINALSFDAQWDIVYKTTQIQDGEFTMENGTIQSAEFMSCSEYNYIELENATGFCKDYADGKYSFVAILPNEDITMEDFTESLTAETVLFALENASTEQVLTKIPKFSFDYSTELKDILMNLGITDAFIDAKADFSFMGEPTLDYLYMDQVIHKTTIAVDAKGTTAGAVTVVGMATDSAGPPDEPKEVYLDRPFYFMIIDNEYNCPIFMGSVMSL